MNANEITKGAKINFKGQVREVISARTFGGRTDITLAGVTSRYNTSTVQFAATTKVEVA